MPFDPATIITSAVAGGISGVALASWKTGREEVAKRRMVARDQVHDAVSELLSKAIAYESGLIKGRADTSDPWIADYEWASTVAVAARRLGPIRRRLVRRRLRILVGKLGCAFAHASPVAPGVEHDDAIFTVMVWRMPSSISANPSDLQGLLTAGLKEDCRRKETKKLRRHLTRLSKAR